MQGASDALVASWRLADGQSALDDVRCAIGTSPGGTQLQEFATVPHAGAATAYGLRLPHDGSVYVTVGARNAAGHVARFESTAVHIDLTPPEITALQQPMAVAANASAVDVAWTATDAESAVVWCQVGLGRAFAAQRDGLVAFGEIDAIRSAVDNATWSVTLPISTLSALAHGERAVAAVRCGNAAGLLTEIVSARGTLRLTRAPPTAKVWVRIARPVGVPVATFASVAGAQAESSGLVAYWNGFAADSVEDNNSDSHVAKYETRLLGPGQDEAWTSVGRVREVHFGNLTLPSGSIYTVEVRATNVAGMVSAVVAAAVRVVSIAPVATDSSLCATWPKGGGAATAGVLVLGWHGAFLAAPCPAVPDAAALGLDPGTCLCYEVNVGRFNAGGDVIRQVQTALHELVVPASHLVPTADLTAVDESVAYVVTVTAINAAGVSKARRFAVQGAPQC